VSDVGKEIERLRAAGIQVADPIRNGRKRPDGTQLDWETARVGTEPNGTFFPFLIRDFTPREARAFPAGHPTTNAYRGISRVIIAVRDLKSAEARYAKAFGLRFSEREDRTLQARLAFSGESPVVLASPMNEAGAVAERIAKFGDGPCAFVLKMDAPATGKLKVDWFNAEKLGWFLGVER